MAQLHHQHYLLSQVNLTWFYHFGTSTPSTLPFVPSQSHLVLQFWHKSTIQCLCWQEATMSFFICHKSTIQEKCWPNSTSLRKCSFGLFPPPLLIVGLFPPPVFCHKSTSQFWHKYCDPISATRWCGGNLCSSLSLHPILFRWKIR